MENEADEVSTGLAIIAAVYISLQIFFGVIGMVYGYTAKEPKCLPNNIFGRINIGFNAGCELTKPRYK